MAQGNKLFVPELAGTEFAPVIAELETEPTAPTEPSVVEIIRRKIIIRLDAAT